MVLKMGHKVRPWILTGEHQCSLPCIYLVVVIILLLPKVLVYGEKKFGIKKHWGYLINCNHILYIQSVSVNKCAEECLYHMNCNSVNYIVNHNYCELCANDDISGNVRRTGGLYVKKNEMAQEPLLQGCNCSANETCRYNEGVYRCETEECRQPPLLWDRMRMLGNRRQSGSKIKYFCEIPATGLLYNYDHMTCQDNGEWSVPNKSCGTPEFGGCFNDQPRVMIESTILQDPALTHEICETHCIQAGHRYFGVEHGMYCFCGNDLPTSGLVNDNLCPTPCSGNPVQICGGYWHIGIYRTFLD